MWIKYIGFLLQVYALKILTIYDSESRHVLADSLITQELPSHQPPFIDYEVSYISDLNNLENFLLVSDPDIIFDLSTSLFTYQYLSLNSYSNSYIHLTVREEYSAFPLSIPFLASASDAELALSSILQYYEWNDVVVISSNDEYSIYLTQLLQKSSLNIKLNVMLSTSSEYNTVKQVIARDVKLSGIRVILVITEGRIAEMVLRACEEAKMSKEGFAYILGPRSYLFEIGQDYEILKNGVLYIGEKFVNKARTEDDLLKEGVESLMKKIIQFCNDREFGCNKYSLIDEVNSHMKICKTLELRNIQNEASVVVGEFIENELRLIRNVIYIGNTSELPSNSPNTIIISIPSETAGQELAAQIAFLTSKLAISEINKSSSMIPNFKLTYHDFGYGTQGFSQEAAEKSVLPNLSKFENSIMLGIYSSGAISFMNFMKSLNLDKSYIGSINTAIVLSSKSDFPNYVRTVPSDAYMPIVYLQIVNQYGWKNIGVIYSDEVWGQGIYNKLLAHSLKADITIANQEEYRKVPPYPSEETSSIYQTAVQKLVESNVRIVMLVVYTEALIDILVRLYDIGMRKGDFVFLAIEWLNMELVNFENEEINNKIMELLRGALQIFPVTYLGDIGGRLKEKLIEEHGREPSYESCFYYDSVWAIGYALKWLLSYGKDYESPQVLTDALRESRFIGCTGLVTIEEFTNDRSSMAYDIINLQYIEGSGTWSIERVGKYDPTSLQILELYSNIQWPDGSSNVPSDIRTEDDCLYSKSEVEELDYKNYILLGICLSTYIVSLLTTVYIWNRWWTVHIPPLNSTVEMSIHDIIAIATMILSCLQYISLGPNISRISPFLQNITDITNAEVLKILPLDSYTVRIVFFGAIAICVVWLKLIVLKTCKFDQKCASSRIMEYIHSLQEHIVPLIGVSGFKPILSIFLSVFVCDLVKGKDSVFDKSVLNVDCTQYCWSDIHIVYSAISAFLIISFTGFVVYYKPLWQSEQSADLHIIQTPYIMLLETLLQLYFVILDKVVKRSYKLLHSILFLIPVTIYLIFTLIKDAYNYKRAGLWQQMCLLGVIWIAIISTLESNIKEEIIIPWYALLLLGWAVIMIVGIILMNKKYPSYLTIKTRNITELFLFQLTRSIKSSKLFARVVPINTSENAHKIDRPDLPMTSYRESDVFKNRPDGDLIVESLDFPMNSELDCDSSKNKEDIKEPISQRLNILPTLFNPN